MDQPVPVPVPVVPAKVRFVLYWISFFASMIAGLVSAAWQIVASASPDVSAPMWVKLAPALLLLVVAQLNALAGSNVTSQPVLPVIRGEAGAVSLLVVGAVLLVAGIIVVFATTVDLLGWVLVAVGAGIVLYAAVSNRGRAGVG